MEKYKINFIGFTGTDEEEPEGYYWPAYFEGIDPLEDSWSSVLLAQTVSSAAYLGVDCEGIGVNWEIEEVPQKYTYQEMGGWSEEIEAFSLEEAIESAKDLLLTGDWGDGGCTVYARLFVNEEEDSVAYIKVEIPAKAKDCQCQCGCSSKATETDDNGISLCSDCNTQMVEHYPGQFWCGKDFDGENCPDCDEEIQWGMIQTKQGSSNTCYGSCDCENREWIEKDQGGWVISVQETDEE